MYSQKMLCSQKMLGLLFVILWYPAMGAAQSLPNVVFLLADDQCTYSMGCYGTPGAKTPNLDALARDGITFDNHYDTTAICMGSRASIMTGLFEYRTGCNFEHGPLLRSLWEQSYPMQLRKAGYQVAFAGKFGFVVADAPNGKGVLPESNFDRWGGGPGQTHYETRKNKSMADYADAFPHSTLSYGAFGRDFVRDASQSGEPFCLSISFKAPHQPVQPDPKFDAVYRDALFIKPSNYGRANGSHFAEQSRRGRQYERFESWQYASDYDTVMAKYYQQIYAIDVAVGMILDSLEAHGVADNTVIIYTSDNGFLCGSHGYGSKVLPYEEASRVPLIVFDPRHRTKGQGVRCKALTGNVDFAPTLLRMAGLEPSLELDGRDLSPLLAQPELEIHDHLPLINVWGPREVHSLAIVTSAYKYIYWPYAEGDLSATEELYDMENDRLELHQLAGLADQAPLLATARKTYAKALSAWQTHAVDFHDYQQFGVIFDPSLPWTLKKKAYDPK